MKFEVRILDFTRGGSITTEEIQKASNELIENVTAELGGDIQSITITGWGANLLFCFGYIPSQ